MTASSVIVADGVSKWYADALGVSDIHWSARPGIVGVLGPNGAGKTTLLKLIAGLLRPSRGSVRVLGGDPWASAAVRASIGYCPEHDGLYDELTGLEFVTAMARLSGVDDAAAAAARSLDGFGLTTARDRAIAGYSKGMRQRTKLAQCLVHDPGVVILDEPLTGVDPVARADIVARIRALGEAGRTVVVSSHVLYEIEAVTQDIVVVYRGQVLAEGDLYAIRALIDRHPHRVRIDCDRPRQVARRLAESDHVTRLSFEPSAVIVETTRPDDCYDLITSIVVDDGVDISGLTSPDNNLAAVFDYLTGGAR
jgi:ABC-2 type transport system ATP-binding protein